MSQYFGKFQIGITGSFLLLLHKKSVMLTTPSTTIPRLEMRGITKKFHSVTALQNVNLTVYPAEVHALMGENGAGKSTLQ